jgi:hypothetical protein
MGVHRAMSTCSTNPTYPKSDCFRGRTQTSGWNVAKFKFDRGSFLPILTRTSFMIMTTWTNIYDHGRDIFRLRNK